MKINEITELTLAQYRHQAGIEIFLIHVVTAEICTAHVQYRSQILLQIVCGNKQSKSVMIFLLQVGE